MGTDSLLVRAARGERTERPPVWLMRQAGRSDPEYLRLREASGLPLEDLFRHPEWASTLSLLPRRIGVDAIIFYQDILIPLGPLGAEFVFRPGPQLVTPVAKVEDLERLQPFDVAEKLGFVGETLDRLHTALAGELPVLGFAGAPFTDLVFILEGGSFGDAIPKTEHYLKHHAAAVHAALDRLTAMTIAYLKYQAQHHVVAVQLFESAAHLVDGAVYREFALPYQQRVFEALRGTVKTINFARELHDVALLGAAGADIVSLPAGVTIPEARAILGPDAVVQGNLDNHLLAHGTWPEIEAAARACLAGGEQHGHIFNLSHGLLRDTPFEHVCKLVALVRNQE